MKAHRRLMNSAVLRVALIEHDLAAGSAPGEVFEGVELLLTDRPQPVGFRHVAELNF